MTTTIRKVITGTKVKKIVLADSESDAAKHAVSLEGFKANARKAKFGHRFEDTMIDEPPELYKGAVKLVLEGCIKIEDGECAEK
jgi:hypothetical protein